MLRIPDYVDLDNFTKVDDKLIPITNDIEGIVSELKMLSISNWGPITISLNDISVSVNYNSLWYPIVRDYRRALLGFIDPIVGSYPPDTIPVEMLIKELGKDPELEKEYKYIEIYNMHMEHLRIKEKFFLSNLRR